MTEPTPTKTVTRTYVDVETTGLDPEKYELLEVAVVQEEVSPPYNQPGTITQLWSQKILPMHIEKAEAKALEVNGYTPEAWECAVPFESVADRLVELFDTKSVWIGHNPQFDRQFIVKALSSLGKNTEKAERHRIIDTTAIAYMAWGLDGRLPLGLNALREFLHLDTKGAHGALKDAMDCRAVFYLALAKLFNLPVV